MRGGEEKLSPDKKVIDEKKGKIFPFIFFIFFFLRLTQKKKTSL